MKTFPKHRCNCCIHVHRSTVYHCLVSVGANWTRFLSVWLRHTGSTDLQNICILSAASFSVNDWAASSVLMFVTRLIPAQYCGQTENNLSTRDRLKNTLLFHSECVPNLVVVLTGRFHAVLNSVRISLELRLKLDVLNSSPQLNVLRFMKWEHCSLITRIIVIITVAVVIADIIVAFIVIKAGFGKYVFLLAEWNLILRFASTNLQWQFVSEYDLNFWLTVTPGASVFAPPPFDDWWGVITF
jgi:hypothetical protein